MAKKRKQADRKKKTPPLPPGVSADRWEKMLFNSGRALRLTGVMPLSSDGWEKVAVILMDMLDGKAAKQ